MLTARLTASSPALLLCLPAAQRFLELLTDAEALPVVAKTAFCVAVPSCSNLAGVSLISTSSHTLPVTHLEVCARQLAGESASSIPTIGWKLPQ